MFTIEASPISGFFRLNGSDFPEKNYSLRYEKDISNEAEVNISLFNVYSSEVIVNSRRPNEFVGVNDLAELVQLLEDFNVTNDGESNQAALEAAQAAQLAAEAAAADSALLVDDSKIFAIVF